MASAPVSDRPSLLGNDTSTTIKSSGQKRKFDELEDDAWDQLTKVLVGEKDELFWVHTHILRKVPFFRGYLDAEMIEKKEGCVRLPEDHPEAVKTMVNWLYRGQMPFDILALSRNTPTGGGEVEEAKRRAFWIKYHLVFSTYVLAQKFLVEDLQNHILDVCRKMAPLRSPTGSMIEFLFNNVPINDKLLEIIKQFLAYRIKCKGGWSTWKTEGHSQYTVFALKSAATMEFIIDAMVQYPDGKQPSEIGKACDYHVHVDTPKCRPVIRSKPSILHAW